MLRYGNRVIFVFSLLLLVVFSIFPASAQDTTSGKIAFTWTRDGHANVFIINPDGSDPVNLTNSDKDEDWPMWSPDGKTIAFIRNETGEDDGWDIYTVGIDGAPPKKLTDGRQVAGAPVWSPDGKQIAFAAPDPRLFLQEIFVINADGSNESMLGDLHGEHVNPSWSPDGTKIASGLTSTSGSGTGISVGTLKDGNKNIVESDGLNNGPLWSPDGSKIGYFSAETYDSDWELFVMNPDGSNPVQLTNNDAYDGELAWSPDGTKLMIASLRDGNPEVYVMNADGSNQVNLSNKSSADHLAVWSPDGTQIAFISDRLGNDRLLVMNADGSNVVRLTKDEGDASVPAWQPIPKAGTVEAAPTEAATAAESGASTASATPTETAASANAATCSVTAKGNVNLRSGPGTTFDRAGTLSAGLAADADGQNQAADGFTWYHLVSGGWVRADLVTAEAACDNLAAVSP